MDFLGLHDRVDGLMSPVDRFEMHLHPWGSLWAPGE